MSFLGSDTDELRDAGQKCEEGKEITDTVIKFLMVLITILKAASFFSGGASLAYAEYLETTVVPWLQKISQALGLFAKVLGANAEAQDKASAGELVDFSKLPTYRSPQMPNEIAKKYDGSILADTSGAATAPATQSQFFGPGDQSTPSTTIHSPNGLSVDPRTSSQPGQPTTSTVFGRPNTPIASTFPGGDVTTAGQSPFSPFRAGTDIAGSAINPSGSPHGDSKFGTPGALSGGGGLSGGGLSGGGLSGGGGSTGGGPSGSSGGGSVGAGSIDGGASAGSAAGDATAGRLSTHSNPSTGSFGGGTPGGTDLGGSALGSSGEPVAQPTDSKSYGAAAGIAGGAAALGVGGAALASRGGAGANPDVERLAEGRGRGSKGPEVEALQEKLTSLGYDTKGTDGAWGPNTEAAYDRYRADHPLEIRQGSGYTSPDGFDYTRIKGITGNSNVSPEFLRGVEAMSQRLGAKPEHMLAAMSFETGETFSPGARNPNSSATGLIQFMKATAEGKVLNTTTAALARMTPVEQLTYVEKYFEGFRGRLGTQDQVYTAILAGRATGPDATLFTRGTEEYARNAPLDLNRDGRTTGAEATSFVRAKVRGDY